MVRGMKCKRFLVALLFSSISLSLFAQKDQPFPALEGRTAAGEVVRIPEDTRGKVSLLCLAYSQESEAELETWLLPAYKYFLKENHAVFESLYDETPLNLYFIPMVRAIVSDNQFEKFEQQFRNIDQSLRAHVLLYHGNITPYKRFLNMTDKSKPYFFVLDKNGRIVHITSGAYSQSKMDELRQIIERYSN